MKKIGSLCLALVSIFITQLCNNCFAAEKVSKEDVERTREYVINWYNSGEYYLYGHCQGFVNQCWKRSLGGSWSSTCCAKKGWDTFGVDTSIDNIPIGASVFFGRSKGSKCGSCGQYPGHVGFYIGNGEIIHVYNRVVDNSGNQVYIDGSKAGYIRRTTISKVINDGYSYLGWGWHSNKELESTPAYSHGRVDSNTSNDDSALSIDLTSYPTSLKQGSNFGLRGTISSNYYVKQVKGYIKSGSTTVQSTVDNTNSKSVNVRNLNLNNNLIFNNLGTGDYTLIVSAVDNSGKTVTVKKNFSVYAEQTRADSSLSINLTRYPVTLDAGTSFGLRGSVDSNYSIARVRGYVKDSNGSVVLSSNDTPGSTSMNIQYADLNNSLVFNRLSPGSYTMIVEATDTSGRVVTATKDFSVRSKETYTDNSSSGSGVDGTVQIPSSWDDLSIRTGPSTDYTIVGSMPQGARCTVYPDRTVNGWYYVNYNGIWGYASGRQINLNSGGSAPSNTRVGIINIPSSWDDLSIRTGPSTDYTIVGSMPQGARCTVYPDRTSGGWYYVEYNGVQGYAAGNRINLQ